jgi:hypothetical protein
MAEEVRNNPNKVNQYTDPDPRQSLFLQYYLDPKSETFSNALQSGLKAGYAEEYSKTILSQDIDWLSESLNQAKMVRKAENNLDNALDIDIKDEKIGERGLKATVFVLSRLGKDKGYSDRTELTGKDGKDLLPIPLLENLRNVRNNNSPEEGNTTEEED